METKNILITGATSGVGLAGAEEMARRGWHVYLHGRSSQSCQAAIDTIKAKLPSAQIEGVVGDLSTKAGINGIATSIKERCKKLDVLWNNAGMISIERKTNAEGFEMLMAVNHLAPFRLTLALLPLVQANGGGRIVHTASGAQAWAKLDLDNWMAEGKHYSPMGFYSKSKLANVLFTRELATRYGSTGIIAHCYHPGFVRSDFSKSRETNRHNPLFQIGSFLAISPAKGADTGVFLATDDEALKTNGRYWSKRKLRQTNKLDNPDNARRLWELSEKATTM